MKAKQSYTKAELAFSIASLLIGVFAVLDACLTPVTWQHCHGDRGLSNHLCNDPYSPEGRWRDGGAEGGRRREEAGMKAEPAKQRKGGWSRAAGTQTETKRKRKQIFFSTGSRERTILCFLYNEQKSLKKKARGEVSEKCMIMAGGLMLDLKIESCG